MVSSFGNTRCVTFVRVFLSASFSWFDATHENVQLVAFFVSSGSPNTDQLSTDVHLPSFPARVENATLRDHISLLRDNFLNTIKNISRCATPLLYSSGP